MSCFTTIDHVTKKDLGLPFTRPKVTISGDKSVNCIYLEKNSFISIHSEIT